MLNGEVVPVPHLFGFLRPTDVLVIYVGGQRVGLHLRLVQHVVQTDFHVWHGDYLRNSMRVGFGLRFHRWQRVRW